MRSWLLAGVLAAAMALGCASAGATTYCVPAHAGCTGIAKATLADAVTAANGDTAVDDILLGAGTFPATNVVASISNPVHIAGAGMDSTTIEGATSGTGLTLYGPDQRISDLTIHEPDHGHTYALYLDAGTATRVRADQRDNSDSSATAVSLFHGASFLDGEALARTDTIPVTYGVYIDNDAGQDSLVSRVKAAGGYAIDVAGAGSATIRFAQATGKVYGVMAEAAEVLIEDSTVTGAPVVAYLTAGDDIDVTVRHVTLSGTYAGVESDVSGKTARLTVSNTAVVGGDTDPETPDLYLRALSGATGIVDVDYSFFRAAHVIIAGAGTKTYTPGAHNIDVADAKLLDIPRGDLRPRWDSPLVDRGDPVPGAGEPMADLAGADRTVNGVTDIGAHEYGRHAPTISAAASPTSALTGDAITFSAAIADADPNELPEVTWSFDDGTTAAGSLVTHAFSTPGTHVATATATDPAGLTATAFAPVTVSAPSLPRKAMAPGFGFKKLTARKGFVRVVLSCPVIAADCRGTVFLRLAANRRVELGRAKYRIARGTKKSVRVRLSNGARRRLRTARRGLRVKLVARPIGAGSKSKTVRLTGR